MADEPVIIEVALHELVSKAANPNVPYGPDEVAADAAACFETGATLLHFHARDAASGAQRWHDDAVYNETVAAIRARGVPADVPWYPTYPGVRPEVRVHDSMPHLAVLAQEPARLELAAIDVGSGNLERVQPRDTRVHESGVGEAASPFAVRRVHPVLPRERRAPVPRHL